jgi:hypothetical protein
VQHVSGKQIRLAQQLEDGARFVTGVEGGAVVIPRNETQPVRDTAPTENGVTDYDRLHLVTYLRLLDADAAGVDPNQIMRDVLQIDPVVPAIYAIRMYWW